MNNITIKAPISPETKDVELALPFYRKDKTGSITEYFGAINEDTFINFYVAGTLTLVSVSTRSLIKDDKISNVFQQWETIDEEEFLEAHAKALASMSLVPQLAEGADDLKGINI